MDQSDDCWRCIIEELEGVGDAELARELREALEDEARSIPLSPFEALTTMHRNIIETHRPSCRAQWRCS